MTASDGFSSMSAYSQDFTELLIAEISAARKSTEQHLNHTLDKTKLFTDQGRMVSGMNFPARQGLMVFDTLSWRMSPLAFLVCVHS